MSKKGTAFNLGGRPIYEAYKGKTSSSFLLAIAFASPICFPLQPSAKGNNLDGDPVGCFERFSLFCFSIKYEQKKKKKH